MKQVKISSEGLKELLENAEQKENYLKSLSGTTFQEQQLISLIASQRDLL